MKYGDISADYLTSARAETRDSDRRGCQKREPSAKVGQNSLDRRAVRNWG